MNKNPQTVSGDKRAKVALTFNYKWKAKGRRSTTLSKIVCIVTSTLQLDKTTRKLKKPKRRNLKKLELL
jgi:hypothetical protein